MSNGGGDAADLRRVLSDELAHIRRHRYPREEQLNVVQRSLVGLAMSGGGIRSATTNLGMLQALARMQILQMVDYVSTVSGGGYIGACMSSLLSWNQNALQQSPDPRVPFTFAADERPAFSTDPATFPFITDYTPSSRDIPSVSPLADPGGTAYLEPPHPRAGTGIVAHLRTHGNFLFAHSGLFRSEALRGLGSLTLGAVYNAVGFLLCLFAASAVYLTIVLAMAPKLDVILSGPLPPRAVPDTTHRSIVAVDSSIVRTHQQVEPCKPGSGDCTTATTTTLHAIGALDELGRNWRMAEIVVATAWSSWSSGNAPFITRLRDAPTPFRPLLLGLLLGLTSVIGIRIWISRRLRNYWRAHPPALEPGDSVEDEFQRHVLRASTLVLAASICIAVIAGEVAWRNALSTEEEIVWLFVPLAVVTGAWLSSFIANTVILPLGKQWNRRSRSLHSAFYAIVSWGWWALLGAALAPLAIYALRDHPLRIGIGAAGSLVLSRFFAAGGIRTSRLSLSPRVLRFVLGIAVFLALAFGGLFFAALLTKYSLSWVTAGLAASIAIAILAGLGWLVNHNRVGPQYFYRDRLSETYLFTEMPDDNGRLRVFRDAMEMPLDCLHGRSDDANWKNPAPYHLISAAINLAGSRDLTRKDRKSGYWLFSKLYCGSVHTGFRETSQYRGGNTHLAGAMSISGAAASSGIGKDTFFAQAFATVLFNIRLGSWLENPAHPSSLRGTERGIFWPWYLLREARMSTNETARLVNLSDGGHTGDNIGIYPLFQRRCKVIIACDAERDPNLHFGSFTEALRHAYIDMGVEVDIDLSMVRPERESGRSRSHCAVGRIHYPDRPDQESFLVYMKNSLTGDEPETVLNYKSTCADFPHEPTADQFFDDAQFESYRALGVHIVEHTFGPWFDVAGAFDVALAHSTRGA